MSKTLQALIINLTQCKFSWICFVQTHPCYHQSPESRPVYILYIYICFYLDQTVITCIDTLLYVHGNRKGVSLFYLALKWSWHRCSWKLQGCFLNLDCLDHGSDGARWQIPRTFSHQWLYIIDICVTVLLLWSVKWKSTNSATHLEVGYLYRQG